MRTFINSLKVKGFKSFNRQGVHLEFCPNFNVLVGANGSGKSNLIDSLCFVLGKLSTKSLRAENLGELVHKSRIGKDASEGEISFQLDNSAGVFPINSKIIEVSRRLARSGQAQYRVNGKRATRQQIMELLSISKISPEGHNIILQGDVDRFISMSPLDKRRLIEEIAGISVYETKKEAALKELQKVDEKLKEARIILTEKDSYLKGLEGEKKQAERYLSYKHELDNSKATEVRLKLSSVIKKRNNLNAQFEKTSKQHSNLNKEIEAMNKKIGILKDKIEVVEKKIEKKGGEDQLSLQKNIEELKINTENSKNLINSSKHEIQRIDVRKSQLQKSFTDIVAKLSEKEKEKRELEKQKLILAKREEAIKRQVGVSAKDLKQLQANLEKEEQELLNLTKQKEDANTQLQKIESEQKLLDYKLSEINKKVGDISEQKKVAQALEKEKEKYQELIQHINSFTNRDSTLAESLNESRRMMIKLEEELAIAKINATSTKELLLRDRAIGMILKSKTSGVLGTVAELGTANSKYAMAMQVAAGSRVKNIVVENENTAVRCLNMLKSAKAGTATFLPLNKISAQETPEYVRSAVNRRGVVGLAYNLISCEPRFKPIFRHIFRNTLVIENTRTAKDLGIGKFSMVTLDGDVFATSGAITGGYRRKTSLGFGEKEAESKMGEIMNRLTKLRKEIKIKEKEKAELEKKISDFQTRKIEIEGTIGSVKDIEDPSKVLSERDNLTREFNSLNSKRKELEKQTSQITEKVNRKTIEKNALKSKIKELQFGKSREELNKIESEKSVAESRLTALIATIENALLPERENISKVLMSLEKECREFEAQIKKEEKDIADSAKELAIREREEKSFYGELKSLFAEKNQFNDFIKKEEERVKELSQHLAGENEEKNSLSIANAKLEASLTALREELEPYAKAKTLSYLKGPMEAKKKQEEMKIKIEQLGSVNMRALEIYESVKKEFDSISWRVNKLSTEKDSVLDVINRIEHKKIESFMETFSQINKSFNSIYTKVTDNMKASLSLENPHKPFEGGLNVDIFDVQGQKKYLGGLSGGEKTIVALAFIFAIQEVNPAPFYLLDEIDAALDKVNSEKVAKLLKEYSQKAQLIVISHNDSLLSAADQIYGVWMNKHEESSVNALKL